MPMWGNHLGSAPSRAKQTQSMVCSCYSALLHPFTIWNTSHEPLKPSALTTEDFEYELLATMIVRSCG